MDPVDNPLQLDGDANNKYYAKVGDPDHNIGWAMKHFDEEWPKSKSLREKLGHYNSGGIIECWKYSDRVIGYKNAIRVDTPARTKITSINY